MMMDGMSGMGATMWVWMLVGASALLLVLGLATIGVVALVRRDGHRSAD